VISAGKNGKVIVIKTDSKLKYSRLSSDFGPFSAGERVRRISS